MKYVYDKEGNHIVTKKNADFKVWSEMVDTEDLIVTDKKPSFVAISKLDGAIITTDEDHIRDCHGDELTFNEVENRFEYLF